MLILKDHQNLLQSHCQFKATVMIVININDGMKKKNDREREREQRINNFFAPKKKGI